MDEPQIYFCKWLADGLSWINLMASKKIKHSVRSEVWDQNSTVAEKVLEKKTSVVSTRLKRGHVTNILSARAP